ncbi:MAG: carboxypeptidase regulatory-like domain-containing protein [Planctomycetes bacterium]|nr:carboxypeptidase regulatory-like domain-containing protein [Planctomycetota bacterium]
MQRSNTFLLAAVGAALVVMTVWRLMAKEITMPSGHLTGEGGGEVADGQHGPAARSPDELTGEELAADAPRVVLAVTSREVYLPPLASRVTASEVGRQTPLPTTMLAGTGTNPWPRTEDVDKDGVVLVAIEIDGGRIVRRVAVEAAAPAAITIGPVLVVRGSVRDNRRQPIAGARVWFGAIDAEGNPVEAVTAADGTFESSARASAGVPLVVRAAGYASTWRVATVDNDTSLEFDSTLLAGGTLDVQLAGQADEIEAGRVFVAPSASRATELASYPFFLQSVFGGVPIDAGGRARVTDLPKRGGLHVVVVHPNVLIASHKEVTLDGEHTPCVVPVEFLSGWSGSVMNDAGEAVSGASLLLRPRGRAVVAGSGLRLQPPLLQAIGCAFTRSDGDGSFMLAASVEPGTVLSVRAPGHAGRDVPFGGQPAEPILLPVWQGGELELQLQPPAAGVAWRAQIDVGEGVDLVCPADRPAVVALPHAGAFDLRVTTWVGAEKRGEREYPGVAATGPVIVPAPQLE